MNIIPAQEFGTSRPRISLDGTWGFSYDPDNVGEKKKWFSDSVKLPETITIPGCSQSRRYKSGETRKSKEGDGADPEQFQSVMLKYPCLAPSWYRKNFHIPGNWKGKEIWLHVGGVKPCAEIWINGKKIGKTVSSRCPVRCNLTKHVLLGHKNTLSVRVFWQDLRLDGLFDNLSAWTGLYRSVWIEALPMVSIKGIHVIGKIDPSSAGITVTLRGTSRYSLKALCEVKAVKGQEKYFSESRIVPGRDTISLAVDMAQARLWSPEAPFLYRATVRICNGGEEIDRAYVRFGLRELHTEGNKVILNGKPIFLRGGCDDQFYTDTVSPPASKEFFLKRLRKAKKYGFNYTKSAAELFTNEFLEAADEAGYLVCEEMPFGCQRKHRALRADPSRKFADLFRRELKNIITFDRNHPSVAVYAMASELGIGEQSTSSFRLFNRELPAMTRKLNPCALVFDVTDAKSRGINTKHGKRNTDLLENTHYGQEKQCPLITSSIKGIDRVTVPFILHEYNWWTGLPRPELRKRYQRLPLRALGVPEMEQAARRNGLSKLVPLFVENSHKLKNVLRKYGLELARKHPRIAGYHHWLINDFNYCPEGVFNEFWEEPKDLSAEEFRTYNDDTVLLLEDGNERCFECGTKVRLDVMASHFGKENLTKLSFQWILKTGKRTFSKGRKSVRNVTCGTIQRVAQLNLNMPEGKPHKMELQVELSSKGKRVAWNHWDVWCVPGLEEGSWTKNVFSHFGVLAKAYKGVKMIRGIPKGYSTKTVLAAKRLDDDVIEYLAQGGRVVLFSDRVLPDDKRKTPERYQRKMSSYYRTVPWNTGSEGNMGTVMKKHPALGAFPHEGWCDIAFAPLIQGVYPIDLVPFYPRHIDPIIRSIGHYKTMRDKAYMFEVMVGKGRLLITSLCLPAAYRSRPLARYLVDHMLTYASGSGFKPQARITAKKLRAVLEFSNEV